MVLCGLIDEDGDWSSRGYRLTNAGETLVLAMLRATAAGPVTTRDVGGASGARPALRPGTVGGHRRGVLVAVGPVVLRGRRARPRR